MRPKIVSFLAGFLLLFFIYHFPEFFTAFWIMAVFKIGFLLVAFVTGRLQGWKGLEGFGLGWRMGWWQQLLKGLLLGFLFFGLAEGLSVAFGYEKFNGIAATEVILKQLPLILLMTFFPSIAEDLLTRGYLYGHLFSKMKPWHWVLLSAALGTFICCGICVESYLATYGKSFCAGISFYTRLSIGFHRLENQSTLAGPRHSLGCQHCV